MKYLPHTHILCLEYGDFVQDGICNTEANYDQLKFRGKIKVHGRGGNGSEVLIEYETLPDKYKMLVRAKYGDVYEYQSKMPILKMVAHNEKARQFFATHTLPNGLHLGMEYQHRYQRQAEWLDMMLRVLEDKRALKDVLKINIDTFWKQVRDLHQLDKPVNPELPVTYDALRRKLNNYKEQGCHSLVSNKFGNQNTRKVTPKIENLIISLYCMDHKPYLNEVCRKYKQFMAGTLQVVDMSSGEIFNPQEFYVKDKAYVLGESTVDYYIKKPANIQAIDHGRMRKIDWRAMYHPAVMRKAPMFAFSKITMDDVDIPFKDLAGQRPVKSYQIADVASGAIIGKAFSPDKNVELLREALRDMFQLIICNGWGVPAEIEMEKHLTQNLMGKITEEEITEDILTEANVFRYVHVCLGGNAREKRMEHVFRRKKYEFQNKRPGFQGRFYARLLTNRLNSDNDRVRYTYEQIVQNELDDIDAYNNSLHPNQELYPNMTRWEVLENYQNPTLTKYPAHTIMPYIGYKVDTSIRGGYVAVQYNKYRLPDINLLENISKPEVTAYYIPGANDIERIYIYQDGKYLCEGIKMAPFNEAKAEQTDADRQIMEQQWGYQKQFDAMVRRKKGQISKVGTGVFDQYEEVKEVVVIRESYEEMREKVLENESYEGGYKQISGAEQVPDDMYEDTKTRVLRTI